MPNTIVINDGGEITVRELNDEEKAMNAEMAEAFDLDLGMERAMRDSMLAESDWTQYAEDNSLSDEKKAEWATYRQALRDRFTDKTRISELDPWPTPPS
tara:strand:+ start:1020 stop:1316 length:297 start_codon:yes stop_codon:yes gene_type:complete